MRHEARSAFRVSEASQYLSDMFSLANTLRKIAAQNDRDAREFEREAKEWRSDVFANIARKSREEAARCRGDARWYLGHIRALEASPR